MNFYRVAKGFYPNIEYLQDMSGRWTALKEKAAKFTDRSMAWDIALDYQERGVMARASADNIALTMADLDDYDFWKEYSERHYNYEANE